MKRRAFLQSTGTAAAWSTIPGRVLGANDRIRVGVVGCGNIARANVPCFLNSGAEIVAICDVKADRMGELADHAGLSSTTHKVGDYRRLLDEPGLDAALVCTPDHWHAIPTIEACHRGLDVYVEKPLAHNIAEGRAMVKAARTNNRIVQMGTQQRSGEHFQQAVDLVRTGYIGDVTFVRCWNVSGNPRMRKSRDQAPPADLDWDMWLGPAAYRQYNPDYYRSFRHFFDFAGGMMTDWFTHWVDIVQWALDVQYPHSAVALGDQFVVAGKTLQEMPDTVEATLQYDSFVCTYTNRKCNGYGLNGKNKGILFFGTKGTMFLDRREFRIYPEFEERDGEQIPKAAEVVFNLNTWELQKLQRQHHADNFLHCMRTREKSISDVEEGHYSTVASHLCNVALRSGERIKYDGERETVTNHPEANAYLRRDYRQPYVLPS